MNGLLASFRNLSVFSMSVVCVVVLVRSFIVYYPGDVMNADFFVLLSSAGLLLNNSNKCRYVILSLVAILYTGGVYHKSKIFLPLQQMMLRANEAAFKMCTSKSTAADLSKKEKQCVRNAVSSFVEARTLAMQEGQQQGFQ